MNLWSPSLGAVLHREQLTVVRVESGKPDADGVPAEVTVPDELAGLYNVQPVGTNESVGLDRVVTSRWRVSGPLTDQVRSGDRVYRGTAADLTGVDLGDVDLYDVEGRPQRFVGGGLDHVEFIITRQE